MKKPTEKAASLLALHLQQCQHSSGDMGYCPATAAAVVIVLWTATNMRNQCLKQYRLEKLESSEADRMDKRVDKNTELHGEVHSINVFKLLAVFT